MEDWGRYIETVAEALLGKPTSSNSKELRYGSRGSLCVKIDTGFWDDYESGEGGGTLALIKREKGLEGGAAIDWMRDELKLDIEDRRSQQQTQGQPRSIGSRDQDRNQNSPSDNNPDRRAAADKPRPKIVATYNYTAENGDLLFQVCRMEPKNFRQRRKPRPGDAPDKIMGGWVWNRDGVAQVPYRLTELIEAIAEERTVFIVEGEKDVDNLAEQGVIATCNAGGAGKWPDELTAYFRDADVVILPDNDPQAKQPKTEEPRWHPDGRPVLPGQDHAKSVAAKLAGVARSVRILQLPGLPPKGDVSDWLGAGGTSSELYSLVRDQAISPEAYRDLLDRIFGFESFVSKFGAVIWGEPRAVRTPYQYLIKGLIPRRESVLIYGESQSGKSLLTQDMAMAVARGGLYCGRKVRRGIVVYCAAEGGVGFVDRRMPGYAAGAGISIDEYLPFVCLTKKFDLFGDEQQLVELIAEIKRIVAWLKAKFGWEDLELEAVVIDTLNKVTPGMDEINGKEVGIVMARLDRIREECNCGLWLVHHKNAAGTGPRGHTSLYAAFETALEIGRTHEMIRCDDGLSRERRTNRVAKQREGEDNTVYEFYLKGIPIGYDEDGDPISSPVVEWLGASKDQSIKVKRPEEDAGINMTAQNKNVYRALRRAIDEFGIPTPSSLGLPKAVARVVDRKYWGQVYRKNFAADDSEDAVKKALQRGNNFLIDKGIIARENPWVWITGKRIRGDAAQSAPPREEVVPKPAAAVDDAGSRYDFGDGYVYDPDREYDPDFVRDDNIDPAPPIDAELTIAAQAVDASQMGAPAE